MEVLRPWLPSLTQGATTTVFLLSQVLVIATVAGIVCGVALLRGPRPIRVLIRAYVDFMRGLPVLVLLLSLHATSGVLVPGLSSVSAAVLGLSIFATAHVTEIVRGGIGSLSRTTTEAAEVIGLTALQRFRLVTVPLVLPRVIPPWVNTAVEVSKATSLVSLMSVLDLMQRTQSAVGSNFLEPWPFYLFAAAVYLAIGLGLSSIGALVERRYRYLEY
jgi:polar amino acid transport system permease protein